MTTVIGMRRLLLNSSVALPVSSQKQIAGEIMESCKSKASDKIDKCNIEGKDSAFLNFYLFCNLKYFLKKIVGFEMSQLN